MGYKLKRATIWRDNSRLPSEYQEVEYIQSTATNPWATSSSWQCINTWFTHTPNTKVEIDYQFSWLDAQQRIFGSETTNSSYSTFVTYINWSTQRARATKDWTWNWQTTSVSADTSRHTFILDKSTYQIYTSWTQIYSWNNAYTITKNWEFPLAIFATRNTDYVGYFEYASAKLYSCKIWDNNVLQRDFVPCYRIADGEIWLYDLVNDVFYTNAWTGTFTKWNDVWLQELQLRPSSSSVLFDFGDWTSTTWNRFGTQSPEWTVTKSVNQITFYNSGFCRNYMETYIIDWTRDFLLEMNADIPNTTQSNHRLGLIPADNSTTMKFETNYESAYRNKMWCCVGATFYANGTYYWWDANSWPKDYFIKKEWTVLTMGRDNTTIYTDNNYTFADEYYLCEWVYNKTLTIYTAKLTYL